MPSIYESGMPETKEKSPGVEKSSPEQAQAPVSGSESSLIPEAEGLKPQPPEEKSPGVEKSSALQVQATTSVSRAIDTPEQQALQQFRMALIELAEMSPPRTAVQQTPHSRAGSPLSRWWARNPYRGLTYDELVAKYVVLWSILEKPELRQYSMQALLGVQFLRTERLTTAAEIFSEIEFQTSTPAALTYVMRGLVRFIVTFGVVAIYFLSLRFLLFVINPEIRSFTNFQATQGVHIGIAAICGMLGSVISILLRLGEFEKSKGRSQAFLMWTGATLPLVGGVFGAFVAALLSAKVINISVGGEELNVWLYVVIGFLSGISERFSRGFIQIAEDRLGGTSQASSPLIVDEQKQVVASVKTERTQ